MSNIHIPLYLKSKPIRLDSSSTFSRLAEKYGWKTYGDVSHLDLMSVYQEEFQHYTYFIKQLSFQGVEFSDPIKGYPFHKLTGDGTAYNDKLFVFFQSQSDELFDFEGVHISLKRLVEFEVNRKSDLHLIPVYHVIPQRANHTAFFDFLMSLGFSTVKRDELEAYNEQQPTLNVIQEKQATDVVFRLGSEATFSIPAAMAEREIDVSISPSSGILIRLLRKEGYQKLSELPEDITFMTEYPQVGKKKIYKFFENFGATLLTHQLSITIKSNRRTVAEEEGTMHLANRYLLMPKQVQNIPLELGGFPPKVSDNLKKYDIKVIGDLPSELADFLSEHGVSDRIAKQIVPLQLYKHFPANYLQTLFLEFMRSLIRREIPDGVAARTWQIVMDRMDGKTLEEIGQSYKLTKERTRQIVAKHINDEMSFFQKLFEHWGEQLKRVKLMHFDDLVGSDCREVYPALHLLDVVKGLPFRIQTPWISPSSKKIQAELAMFEESFFKNSTFDQVYSESEVRTHVESFMGIDSDEFSCEASIREFCKAFLVREGAGFRQRNRAKLSKAKMCEIVFEREFPDGLHVYRDFEQFREKLEFHFPREFESDEQRSIISNLLRNEELMLWGYGFFQHLSRIKDKLEYSLIYEIRNWIDSQFEKEEINQISTNLPYQKFHRKLGDCGIPNEHALYSSLRHFFPNAYNYSRSPHLVRFGNEKVEKVEQLEEYVKSSGGYLSYKELHEHFIGRLGWKKFMVEQAIGFSQNLMQSKEKNVVHIDTLKLDPGQLTTVRHNAFRKMKEVQGSFSVEAIFEECRANMVSMNISDSKLLYRVMQLNFSNDFEFPYYPHILEVGRYETGSASPAQQFEQFVLEQDYVLREELREEFLEKRKWKESTYYSMFMILRHKILELYENEFIHVDHLDWSSEKQEQLENIVEQYWDQKWNTEEYLNLQEHIFSDELKTQLPKINDNDWTLELLTSFLSLSNSFVLLGAKKRVVVKIGNTAGLKKDTDLVAYILREEFEGAAKIEDVHQFLTRIGLCASSKMPVSFLEGDDLPYQVVGYDIVINELLKQGE